MDGHGAERGGRKPGGGVPEARQLQGQAVQKTAWANGGLVRQEGESGEIRRERGLGGAFAGAVEIEGDGDGHGGERQATLAARAARYAVGEKIEIGDLG